MISSKKSSPGLHQLTFNFLCNFVLTFTHFQALHIQAERAHHGKAGEGDLLHVPELQLQGGLGEQAGGGDQVQPRQPRPHQDPGYRDPGRGRQPPAP